MGAGTVNVNAVSAQNNARVFAFDLAVGAIAADIVLPKIAVEGSTKGHIGGQFNIEASDVNVTSNAPLNRADGDSISLRAAGIGGSFDTTAATTDHDTAAYVGRNAMLTITGGAALDVRGTSNNKASAGSVGIAVDGIGVDIAKSEADASGTTRAYVEEGATVTAAGLNVSANAVVDAESSTTMVTAGGISVDVAMPKGVTSHDVSAYLGPAAGNAPNTNLSGALNVPGTVDFTAMSTSDAKVNKIDLAASGISVEVIKPNVDAGGSTKAHGGGNFTSSANVINMTAMANNTAESDTLSIEAAGIAVELASRSVKTSHATESFVGQNANIVFGGDLQLNAKSTNTASVGETTPFNIGGIGVAVADSIAEAAGSTSAFILEGAIVDVDGLSLDATGTNNASADALFVGIGGINVELTKPVAITSHEVQAYVGPRAGTAANASLSGEITVDSGAFNMNATANNTAAVDEIDIEIGGISVERLRPEANAGGSTKTYLGGNFALDTAAVNANAMATNIATSDSLSIELTGIDVDIPTRAAQTTHDAVAFLRDEADITVDGGSLNLNATSTNTASTGETTPFDLAGISVAVAKSEANVGGSTDAYVGEGVQLTADGLHMDAIATNNASADALFVGISGISVEVTKPIASTSHDAATYIGPDNGVAPNGSLSGQLTIDGDITMNAMSTNTAHIDEVDIEIGGITISVLNPEVTAGGSTLAHLGGDFTIESDDLTALAMATNTATADAVSVEIAGIDVDVTNRATATDHDAEAFISDNAEVSLSGGTLSLNAKSTNESRVGETGVDVAGISVAVVSPDAAIRGSTRAFVGSQATVAAPELEVSANADNTAVAKTNLTGVGGIKVDVATPEAKSTHVAEAFVGSGTTHNVNGATEIKANNENDLNAEAKANGVAGIAVEVALADAIADTQTRAFFDTNVRLTGGSLEITATGTDDTFADTSTFAVAGLAGAATVPTSRNTSTTIAEIRNSGASRRIDLSDGNSGDLTVSAEHTAITNARVGSDTFGALAGSGADVDNIVVSNVTARVGDGVVVFAKDISVDATNDVRKPFLGSSNNIDGDTGGIISGAGRG